MKLVQHLLDAKGNEVISIAPEASVFDAIKLMADKAVGSLLVMEGGELKGIVTEVGGWLSHTSILAREYNITTIIGVKGAEYQVQTGDLLTLHLDGTVEVAERHDGALEEPRQREGQQPGPGAASSETSLVA